MNYSAAIFFLIFITPGVLLAQKDTAAKKPAPVVKKEKIRIFHVDTSKPYNPKYAVVRSAVLPGWGQITNKKYWKLPLVYGALGTTTYIF